MKPTKTLVFGGTGLVGSHLLQLLSSRDTYNEILSPVRKAHSSPSPGVKFLNLTEIFEPTQSSLWQGTSSVFICLGTTIKKAGSQDAFRAVDYELPLQIGKKAKEFQIPKVHIVTAMGSHTNSMILYNRVKGEIERDLSALEIPQLFIYRPSLLLGERTETRLGEKIGEAVMSWIPFSVIPGGADLKAIPAESVAKAMIVMDQKPNHPMQNLVILSSGELHKLAGELL